MVKTIERPKTKASEISLLTAILCILVVFIHISSQAVVSLNKTSIPLILIYIPWKASHFVVQGFIFLSALKIYRKYRDTQMDFNIYIAFVKSRLLHIYLPYALWVMIYYLYFCSIGYFPFSLLDYIKYLVIGNLSSPFYFIVIIMQFYMLMPLWLYCVRRFKLLTIISMATGITILMMYHLPNILSIVSFGHITFEYNDRVMTSYLVYWIVGCYAGSGLEDFKTLINKYIKEIFLVTLLLLIAYIVLTYVQFLGIRYFNFIEILRIFYCFGAILSLYSACDYLSSQKNLLTLMLYNISQASFYIYLSHCLVLNIVEAVCRRLGINGIDSIFMIKLIFVYSVPIILCNIYLFIKPKVSKVLIRTRYLEIK